MYRIIIKTKYNVITLEREDYDLPVLEDLVADIEDARIEKIKAKTSTKSEPKENE